MYLHAYLNCLLGFRTVDLLICFIFVGNTQIKWLVDTFRAKIVDISEDSVTIEVIAAHICSYILLVVSHRVLVHLFHLYAYATVK